MGLVARELESRGIPTLALSSAYSITRSVGTPRAAFLDYPLGRTAGRACETEEQRSILAKALGVFETLDSPGEIVPMPFAWPGGDAWKEASANENTGGLDEEASDDRTARHGAPQYQTDEDRLRAEETLASGGCVTCVFPDEH